MPTITQTALISGAISANTGTYVTSSLTPSAGSLVLLAIGDVGSASSANQVPPASVTGCGLTWVQVDSTIIPQFFASISVWRAMGAGAVAGTLEVVYTGSHARFRYAISEFGTVSTVGANGSGAIVQVAHAVGLGTTTLVVNLAGFASASNATYGALAITANTTSTQGTGFNEIYDIGTVTQSLATEWQVGNDQTVDWTWGTNSTCGAIGVELAILPAGGPAFNLERIERHYPRGYMRGGMRGAF